MQVDAYVIWDTHTNSLWKNRSGKKLWNRPSYAKNAWNVHVPYNKPNFTQQDRFECRRVTFDLSKSEKV